MDKVAVLKKDQILRPFTECNRVEIYQKRETGWEVTETKEFLPIRGHTVKEIRKEAEEIVYLLGETKIVLLKDIAGIAFSVFDQKGCCIFSVERADDQAFDGVMEEIEESDQKKRIREEMIHKACPVETDTPGIYQLDLLELQKECPEISSKKALMPFLLRTPFFQLRLTCAHVPPWLERDDTFESKIHSKDGRLSVIVTRKQCGSEEN